jgi:hypothetical protein
VQVLKQHHRAGPSRHQARHSADAGFQIHALRADLTRGHRIDAHDLQGTVGRSQRASRVRSKAILLPGILSCNEPTVRCGLKGLSRQIPIKRITRPMLGFKSMCCARIILAGIETMHMIRKRQLATPKGQGASAAKQFYSLAS